MPRQPDARQDRGPAAERGAALDGAGDGLRGRATEPPPRPSSRRTSAQSQPTASVTAQGPEPRCRLVRRLRPGAGPARTRRRPPRQRRRPRAPRPRRPAPRPPRARRASSPARASMRWTWRRPRGGAAAPAPPPSRPPSPTTTPNTTSPARRTAWAARTVGSTPEVGERGLRAQQAVQRRGVGVGGVGVGQRGGEGVAGGPGGGRQLGRTRRGPTRRRVLAGEGRVTIKSVADRPRPGPGRRPPP